MEGCASTSHLCHCHRILKAVRSTAGLGRLVGVATGFGALFAPVAWAFVGHSGVALGASAGSVVGGFATLASGYALLGGSTGVPDYVRSPVLRSFISKDWTAGRRVEGYAGGLAGFNLWVQHLGSLPSAVIGVSVGIVIGFGLVATASLRHLATVTCLKGRLPLHLEDVLDRAYKHHLLRYAGVAYQFRHIELRNYFSSLADNEIGR